MIEKRVFSLRILDSIKKEQILFLFFFSNYMEIDLKWDFPFTVILYLKTVIIYYSKCNTWTSLYSKPNVYVVVFLRPFGAAETVYCDFKARKRDISVETIVIFCLFLRLYNRLWMGPRF